MDRIVKPELLDHLPPDDVHAIQSRRDLRRLNALMASARNIAHPLKECSRPGRVMDIGGGDGTLSLSLARKLAWRGTEFLLVDRVASVPEKVRTGFRDLDCSLTPLRRDVMTGFDATDTAEIAIANLFLHHFTREELSTLLPRIGERCHVFVACEPRRSAWALLASRCVGLLGCNAITRHDAVASVRAGFSGRELSDLWPKDERWLLSERPAGMFSHLFVARRL